ncbi:MAG: glycosyltransferase family 2 protein [Anaerolineae bacterium]|nr:glycosyltransferase family 2 protein [Anaerolineae bacterium]
MTGAEGVLIVVPAFNEAENISRVVGDIQETVPGAGILVVDDGSLDNTAALAGEAGAKVISLPFNLGYGVALQTGFKYALQHGYEYVVQMDADGQHDPRSVKDLVAEVREGEADVILGSRFLGTSSFKPQFTRKLGIVLFRAIVSRVVGERISDPTSGFQALNRRVLELYATDAFPVDYPDADVLIMAHRAGFKIKEIPVVMYAAAPARKSMHSGFRPLYYVFKMFLSILVTLMRPRRYEGGAGRQWK